MAKLIIKYHSQCLRRETTFELFIPNDPMGYGVEKDERPIRTLFLLHGYTGSADNWVPEDLSRKYRFAVVCPNGENSFWLDGISTGHSFATLLGEELPDYLKDTFGLARSAEDTYILGLSMGGFGALHTAFAYPERFGKVGAMSSALIHREVAGMDESGGNEVANFEYYRECFGDPKKLLGSRNDPEALIDGLLAEGKAIPKIYMCCGTEDFLLERNRDMHNFLCDRHVYHLYHESKGSHDMVFWNEYTQKIVEWMFS